ncbi:hypothetical protein [Longimicrobium sp.]|uniref:hypothetical protein n=1 Tax=Longimicrobium sp. TaxID=2029185 RepID=UPI002ED86CEB
MSQATPASAANAFSSSELVVLFGDQFVPDASMLSSKEEILTSGVRVNSQTLMEKAMHAAVWTLQRAGAVRLEIRQGKALFGLIRTRKLHLVRGTASASYPGGSLEAHLVEAAGMENELDGVLAAFIGQDSHDPPARAIGLMKRGLYGRGLLEVVEEKTLMVFTSIRYVLPASTRELASRQSVQPIKQLLAEVEQKEPELFKAVDKAIDSARVKMTEDSD